ncbi:MAG: NAD-dependent deacylase [Caulobacteraceae bacterium]|nr:NAD-dependent deacylase [Caulobacteraceae bacterium]
MRVFVLTGAGVSAESGLGTFRDAGGVWSMFDLKEVATPEGFARDPAKVHAFYNMRRRVHRDARPNAAHAALSRLERDLPARHPGGALTLVTQNVDELHELAGHRDVIHMHGEALKVRCAACGHVARFTGELSDAVACGGCAQAGGLRPDVVWFGETPMHLARIQEALEQSDLFVAIGTSGTVYPAAGYVAQARRRSIPTLEINLEPSNNARVFDRGIYGPATETVPAWVETLLA